MFYHLPFHPELSSTNVTSIISYMCLFMCKKHLKHYYVKCVTWFKKRKEKYQNTCKKNHKHILIPSQRYQESRNLLLNPKVPKNVMGFSNRAQTFTPLNYLSWDSPLPINRTKSKTEYTDVCYLTKVPRLVRDNFRDIWSRHMGRRKLLCFKIYPNVY